MQNDKAGFYHSHQGIGNLIAAEAGSRGFKLETAGAFVSLELIAAGIVRCKAWKKGLTFGDFSYAVTAAAGVVDFRHSENERQIELTTGRLKVVVQKTPLRIRFYTTSGELLNADDEAFGISWIGDEVTCYKTLQDQERFIGLGEKTGNLDRRGEAYINWNTDHFAYPADADPLYLSTPFYIGLRQGLAYGIYLDNSHQTVFNFGASNDRFAYFSAADGPMDYYFIHHETIAGIVSDYTVLTGRMPLPPLWSLGYHQCRYSYYPDTAVMSIARQFREKDIPADVIYLDIHYMDQYKVFTFDPERFSQPEELVKELKAMGFEVTLILDPGIKKEKGYPPYDDGLAADHFVKYPDGEPYTAQVWPGWSHFPDFTQAKTREWWGDQLTYYTDKGIKGFWNDMNEPANWGQHMPDLIEFDYDGQRATHKKARNIYGLQMARSSYEGALKHAGDQRPFILTRAGFSGIQRYAAVWTGDNVASDEHMLAGVRLVNSLGLTGIANAGYDVGGFVGDPSPELFARWISIGAFCPFFRGHSMINSKSAEPWAFGETVEAIARNYIKLRYRLMPYLYSLFYEASVSGLPVARSLAFDYASDDTIFEPAFQQQYLYGPSILVCPVASTEKICLVYLPEGDWYDLFTDRKYAGKQVAAVNCPPEKLPLFVRAGSCLPMQAAVASLQDKPEPVMDLHIYHGKTPETFDYYEDDGHSYAYENGQFCQRSFRYDPDLQQMVIGACSGSYPSHFTAIRVILHGFPAMKTIRVNGTSVGVETGSFRFTEALPEVDPLGHPAASDMSIKAVGYLQIANSDREIVLSWTS